MREALLVASASRSLNGQPHEVADRGFELLLLLSVVHHHERVDRVFPPFVASGDGS